MLIDVASATIRENPGPGRDFVFQRPEKTGTIAHQ
jgi:hypothetical protein